MKLRFLFEGDLRVRELERRVASGDAIAQEQLDAHNNRSGVAAEIAAGAEYQKIRAYTQKLYNNNRDTLSVFQRRRHDVSGANWTFYNILRGEENIIGALRKKLIKPGDTKVWKYSRRRGMPTPTREGLGWTQFAEAYHANIPSIQEFFSLIEPSNDRSKIETCRHLFNLWKINHIPLKPLPDLEEYLRISPKGKIVPNPFYAYKGPQRRKHKVGAMTPMEWFVEKGLDELRYCISPE